MLIQADRFRTTTATGGHTPASQMQVPLPGWDQRPEIPKHRRPDLLCFLGPLQHGFHPFPHEKGVALSFHHRSISIPVLN